ncbi:hypothetical protein K7X08_035228 [Anisodus acutangulus]|uniref:Membrane-associated kinase regulator 2 n=1 Tax=Anisodus acutangulus TaxID=402998 RepID=A0A9Q1LGU5_9SOLA|nr:hypothetical protein K7X08_035228 [Anisodus acutangulus]
MEAFKLVKLWPTSAIRDIDSVKKFVDAVDYVPRTDEDSFFDLVLTGSNEHTKENNSNSVSVNGSSVKQGKSESPRDVFLKPNTFPIDAKSKPRSPTSMLGAVPKFRVCFLGFRKSNPEKVGIDPKVQTQKLSPKAESNRFTVKCKVEEGDSSKQFVRADMHKYLKLMKPLYSRASKRHTDKTDASKQISRASQLSSPTVQSLSSPRNSSEEKQGNRVAVLGAVRKHLGKSRSTASSFSGVSTSPMNRRDDSLLEQNDGIQSAILHCKRSYSSARKDSSVINANGDIPRASCEEQNRWSI